MVVWCVKTTLIYQQSVCSNVFIISGFFSDSEQTPEFVPVVEPTDLRAICKVTKKGQTTDVTYGHIYKVNHSFRFEPPGKKRYYFFQNCYCISKDGESFFEKGDSGAGVFLIDEQSKILNPLGIGFIKGKWTYVCKIQHVLERFNLKICKDEFSGSFFTDEREEEMKKIYSE